MAAEEEEEEAFCGGEDPWGHGKKMRGEEEEEGLLPRGAVVSFVCCHD